MIRLFIILFILCGTSYSFGQTDTTQIKMIAEYGSKDNDMDNVLLFQNIDLFNVKFIGGNLKSKYFSILAKEIWDGKTKRIDTLINSKTNSHMGKIGLDTLSLLVLGSKAGNDKLKLFFRFPMVGMTRKYAATNSEDYALRAIGADIKIEKNKFFPAFAYILPHIEGNWKEYCAVDKSGVNVEDWGRKFNLKHYIIFEMKFED